MLDASELERGARLRFEGHRVRHAVSHGLLRTLVGHYLRRPPAALRFGEGEFGKPHLEDEDRGRLVFNLSHSGDVVLIALARDGNLGVDVEGWTERMDEQGVECVADSVFSATERAALRRLDPANRRVAFFEIWSRKEAYLKATGLGVSHGLDHFDVSAERGDARLLADRRGTSAVGEWALYDLAPGPGYSGALAIDDRTRALVKLTAVSAALLHDGTAE